MKFRKKPVEIDAVMFEGAKCFMTIEEWSGGKVMRGYTEMHIETLEGRMAVKPGDWVIRGVKGEYYPCKPDIFEMTYEPATTPVPSPVEGGEVNDDTVECVGCGKKMEIDDAIWDGEDWVCRGCADLMTPEWDVTFKMTDGGMVTIGNIKCANIGDAPKKAKKQHDEDMIPCFRLRDCVEIREVKYGDFADRRGGNDGKA